MDRKLWLSPRALRLHAVIVIVVPAFMAMCIWQLSRALAGNELSWAYVFEWPLFAAYAVYMWWRLLHESPEVPPEASSPEASSSGAISTGGDGASPPVEDPDEAARVAYNEYLAKLAQRDRAGGR